LIISCAENVLMVESKAAPVFFHEEADRVGNLLVRGIALVLANDLLS